MKTESTLPCREIMGASSMWIFSKTKLLDFYENDIAGVLDKTKIIVYIFY